MGKCIEGMVSNEDLITVGIAKLCCLSGTSPCWLTWTLLGLHLRTCFCGQFLVPTPTQNYLCKCNHTQPTPTHSVIETSTPSHRDALPHLHSAPHTFQSHHTHTPPCSMPTREVGLEQLALGQGIMQYIPLSSPHFLGLCRCCFASAVRVTPTATLPASLPSRSSATTPLPALHLHCS